MNGCKSYNCPDSCKLGNQWVCFKIVNLFYLIITLGFQFGLKSLNRITRTIFNFIYPRTFNWFNILSKISKCLSSCLIKRIKLNLYCLIPTLKFTSLMIEFWFSVIILRKWAITLRIRQTKIRDIVKYMIDNALEQLIWIIS